MTAAPAPGSSSTSPPGAAETTQFKGEAQGAEQIENALMYVRQGDDKLLEELEGCVDDAV